MMIIPKKGYRVCLECGRISRSRQLVETNLTTGKKVKVCPYCNFPENEKNIYGGNSVFDEYRAKNYFRTVEMSQVLGKFNLSDKDREMITNCYNTYNVPEHLRIY